MNTTIKNIFKLALASAIIFFTATLASDSISIDSLMQDGYSAEKPWFGTDEYNYEAPKEVSPTDAIASKIKWSILVLVVLLVLVLANAFDISSLTSKITGKETINSNNINKWMMLIFMVVGMICVSMFTITLILTTIVFVITQVALFYFAFRYAKKDGQKALYYSHNNKLEVFWTIIPAIVLTILVLRGHQTWKSIVYADEDGTKSTNIEIFAEQFAWSARYAGEDGKLGKVDYKFISGTNKLGLAYQPAVDTLLVELAKAIKADEKAIVELMTITLPTLKNVDLAAANSMKDYNAIKNIEKEIEFIESGDKLDELNESIKRKKTQIKRIIAIKNNPKIFASTFTNAE